MKKIIIPVAVSVVVLLVGFVLVAMNKYYSVPKSSELPEQQPVSAAPVTEQPVQTAPVKKYAVIIKNFAFSPNQITINQGEAVVWTNQDLAPHAIRGANFVSDTMQTGQTYEFQFTEKGTFDYICAIHPSMKGTVIVK